MNWTPDLVSKVFELWKTDISNKKIGERFGVSATAIYRLSERKKWPKRTYNNHHKFPPVHTPEFLDGVRKMRAEGATYKQIEKATGLSRSWLTVMNKRGDLPVVIRVKKPRRAKAREPAPPAPSRPPSWHGSVDRLAQARALWDEGWSIKAIATEMRSTDQAIRSLRERYQWPARTRGPRRAHPITIPLREVYRWGADLGLPLRARGDVEAVSAAIRRENPDHPGFVVSEQQLSSPIRMVRG